MDNLQEAALARVGEVFTPSHPVSVEAVFAGRESQRQRLRRAILEPGRHAVIYGTRGVGKTSLAHVVARELDPVPDRTPTLDRYTLHTYCTRDDDFDRLWTGVARLVEIHHFGGAETSVRDFHGGERAVTDRAGVLADTKDFVTPAMVAHTLAGASRSVFVFDEYDAIRDEPTQEAFADLIKMLSDMPNSPTIVLIGVASDIDVLVGHHESIQRCTEQIQMPPLADHEVRSLVQSGMGLLGLTIDDSAVTAVARLSRGYPAFAHSMAKTACEAAVSENRTNITYPDVLGGAVAAIDSVPYSLGETYKTATHPRHPTDTTGITLAAAAWVQSERFSPTEVRSVLESWGLSPPTLVTIANHLKRLSSPERGSILVAYGENHPAYEFRDPMFVPYVVIKTSGQFPPPSSIKT